MPGARMNAVAEFTIRCLAAWSEVSLAWAECALGGAATPFQTDIFLNAWYATLGARAEVQPVIVEVLRKSDGAPALLLPLVLERVGSLRILSFADGGVSDNTAPILGPAAPETPEQMRALWRDISRALPPADLFVADKQPAELGGRANPILALATPRPYTLSAHPLQIPGTFDEYSRSRLTKFRKEQERVWRVFTRQPGTAFELVKDVEKALVIFRDMERQQSARMNELGVSYRLDDPAYSAFYQTLIRNGLAKGAVSLGALTANGETIGALLGVHDGATTAFVRISKAEGDWSTSSPGRLVIERTMMALREEGVTRFDFSIGDYGYKENFKIGTEPLYELALALSWRGWPQAVARRTRGALRASPLARRIKERFRPPQSFARST